MLTFGIPIIYIISFLNMMRGQPGYGVMGIFRILLNQNPLNSKYRSSDIYYAIGSINEYTADGSNILQGGINAYLRY